LYACFRGGCCENAGWRERAQLHLISLMCGDVEFQPGWLHNSHHGAWYQMYFGSVIWCCVKIKMLGDCMQEEWVASCEVVEAIISEACDDWVLLISCSLLSEHWSSKSLVYVNHLKAWVSFGIVKQWSGGNMAGLTGLAWVKVSMTLILSCIDWGCKGRGWLAGSLSTSSNSCWSWPHDEVSLGAHPLGRSTVSSVGLSYWC
jgi:hypothetical protein